jgi:hypothetical protein
MIDLFRYPFSKSSWFYLDEPPDMRDKSFKRSLKSLEFPCVIFYPYGYVYLESSECIGVLS